MNVIDHLSWPDNRRPYFAWIMISASTIHWIRQRIDAGTPEYPDEPSPHPVLTEDQIRDVETELGFSIPMSLRQIYCEIGNGWSIGGSELIGLKGGHCTEHEYDAVKDYLEQAENMRWFSQKLLLSDWGCCVYSYLDCSVDDGAVFRFDGNYFDPDSVAHRDKPHDQYWKQESRNLVDWLRTCLGGGNGSRDEI